MLAGRLPVLILSFWILIEVSFWKKIRIGIGRIRIHGEREWRLRGNTNAKSDLEFSLQTAAASSRWGGIELGQVGLQWGHLQLRVSIQVVLQQSLEDEHVLHLWAGEKRVKNKAEPNQWSWEEGSHLHPSGPSDSAELWSWSQSQTHPPSSRRSSCPA